jgi:hypothetical protein
MGISWLPKGRNGRPGFDAIGRPGVRVIARQFGFNPGTVQCISRPFAHGVAAIVQ